MTDTYYWICWLNIDNVCAQHFDTEADAIGFAKMRGFEAVVYHHNHGDHIVATYSPLYGVRRHRDD